MWRCNCIFPALSSDVDTISSFELQSCQRPYQISSYLLPGKKPPTVDSQALQSPTPPPPPLELFKPSNRVKCWSHLEPHSKTNPAIKFRQSISLQQKHLVNPFPSPKNPFSPATLSFSFPPSSINLYLQIYSSAGIPLGC